MTSFVLKIIGIIAMFCDHYSDAIIGHFSFLNYIGRIAFPIFAYQCVIAYKHTKNLKNHLLKLFVFGLISQLPFVLFLSTFTKEIYLNIFFTIFLGVATLFFSDKCKNKILGFLVVIISSIIGQILRVDYGAFGIILIFVFYFFENKINDKKIKISKLNLSLNKLLMSFAVILLCFSKYIPNIIKTPILVKYYLLCALFSSLSLIFILFYNKKEGPKLKYFFYIFYPLHLLILYFIGK